MTRRSWDICKNLALLLAAVGLYVGVEMAMWAADEAAMKEYLAAKAEQESVVEVVEEEVIEECPLTVSEFYDVPLDYELQYHIINESKVYDIDPAIVFAMIERESSFRADVIGDNGKSFGLMQIMKHHHEDRMEKLGVTDLLDEYQNVMVGIDFLAELIDRYDGNVEMALVAYNMGASGANKNCFSKGIYSSTYSKAVMERCQDLNESLY